MLSAYLLLTYTPKPIWFLTGPKLIVTKHIHKQSDGHLPGTSPFTLPAPATWVAADKL